MKVLMVATSMGVGGVQSVVRDLAVNLAHEGHDVHLLALTGGAPGEMPTLRSSRSLGLPDMRGAHPATALRQLLLTIREIKPDVVHSHAFHANASAGIAASLTRTPSVRTIHSIREGGQLHHQLARLVARLPGTTVAVSRTVAEAAGLGADAHVIHNAIDTQRFTFHPEHRQQGRAILGAEADEFVIVSVGRLTEAKAYPILIEAADLARDSLLSSRARVIIVGDGPLRQELDAQVRSRGLESLVQLVGECRSIPLALAAADAFVQSSTREGFPLAPLEAMSSGLPVLATRAGGTAEIDPPPLRLVATGDAGELAQGLEHLTTTRGAERRWDDASAIAERYGMERWAQSWIETYRSARS